MTLQNMIIIIQILTCIAFGCIAFIIASYLKNRKEVNEMDRKTAEILSVKEDEERSRFLLIFKKTILRIRDEKRGNPIYLIRYSLITTRWFAIKLHRIYEPDDDCLHDHPWSFISIILSGGYTEVTPVNPSPYPWGRLMGTKEKAFSVGAVLWRPAPWPHRLIPIKPTTTLVITFKKVRAWGFYTSKSWIYWRDYIRSGQKCE